MPSGELPGEVRQEALPREGLRGHEVTPVGKDDTPSKDLKAFTRHKLYDGLPQAKAQALPGAKWRFSLIVNRSTMVK
jgi:hypothetical protein